MHLNLQTPLIYLITSGATTAQTTTASDEFSSILQLLNAAVDARVDLFQIREKQLTCAVLFELAKRAVEICRGTQTRLFINDRADVAVAAGADGVHLTTQSLDANVVRRTFGKELLIGVSTHHVDEVVTAQHDADFVVFGPVYETEDKRAVGLESLRRAATAVAPFPVIALGGLNPERVSECIAAGAQGVAAIRMLNDAKRLREVVRGIRAQANQP